MKIISIERELKIDQNLYIVIIIAFKTYNKKFLKKDNILQKNCQETNAKSIFMNFEIPPLNHNFPQVLIFTDISHCIDQFHN